MLCGLLQPYVTSHLIPPTTIIIIIKKKEFWYRNQYRYQQISKFRYRSWIENWNKVDRCVSKCNTSVLPRTPCSGSTVVWLSPDWRCLEKKLSGIGVSFSWRGFLWRLFLASPTSGMLSQSSSDTSASFLCGKNIRRSRRRRRRRKMANETMRW